MPRKQGRVQVERLPIHLPQHWGCHDVSIPNRGEHGGGERKLIDVGHRPGHATHLRDLPNIGDGKPAWLMRDNQQIREVRQFGRLSHNVGTCVTVGAEKETNIVHAATLAEAICVWRHAGQYCPQTETVALSNKWARRLNSDGIRRGIRCYRL
jgi:hypothetical protein